MYNDETRPVTVHDILTKKVNELKKELPRISLGYMGDLNQWGDTRTWYVFVPHPERVGQWGDKVMLGASDALDAAVANWDEIAKAVRIAYHDGTLRVKKLKYHDGKLIGLDKKAETQYKPPHFESIEAAEAWLAMYNYPYTCEQA